MNSLLKFDTRVADINSFFFYHRQRIIELYCKQYPYKLFIKQTIKSTFLRPVFFFGFEYLNFDNSLVCLKKPTFVI